MPKHRRKRSRSRSRSPSASNGYRRRKSSRTRSRSPDNLDRSYRRRRSRTRSPPERPTKRKHSKSSRRSTPEGPSLSTNSSFVNQQDPRQKDMEEPPTISAVLMSRFQQLGEPEIQPTFDSTYSDIDSIKAMPTEPFEMRADIRSLICNPNSPYAYGFPRRIAESCIDDLFQRRPLKPKNETAESLRDHQQAKLIEIQIRKAGDYIRQGQNFEAIQCCNNALNMAPESTDALLGRAIAANNMENYVSAVIDLERILEIAPQHSKARSIIDKVLIQQAEKFEENHEYDSAKKTYERAANEFGNQEAIESLQKLQEKMSKQKNGRDCIDLTGDDDHNKERRHTQRKEETSLDAEARRKRLDELERFKRSLEAKRVRKRH